MDNRGGVYRGLVLATDPANGEILVSIPSLTGASNRVSLTAISRHAVEGFWKVPEVGSVVLVGADDANASTLFLIPTYTYDDVVRAVDLYGDFHGPTVFTARNDSGTTLSAGTVVAGAADGGELVIVAANANDAAKPAIGILVDDIGANGYGKVAVSGYLSSVDTNAYAANTDLYVGTTGNLVSTPVGLTYPQVVAKVLTVGTPGSVLVTIGSRASGTGASGNYNGIFTGTIYATAGNIGGSTSGWVIDSNRLESRGTVNKIVLDGQDGEIYIGAYGTGVYNGASTPFYVNEDGYFSLGTKLTFDPTSSLLSINGTIVSTAGSIGGWNIQANKLTSGTGSSTVGIASSGGYPFYAGASNPAVAPFRVTDTGLLTASGVDLSGHMVATSGSIGGWSITAASISSGGATPIVLNSSGKITVGNPNWANSANGFYADNTGKFGLGSKLTWDTTNLIIDGTITAASGTIGGWSIDTAKLYAGTGSNFIALSSDNAVEYRTWAGHPTPASAPFFITKTGGLYANNASISGLLTSSSISGSLITGTQITGGSITGNYISGGSVSGGYITGGSIFGPAISGGTVTGGSVYGGLISGASVVGTVVSGTTLTGASITGSSISGGQINIGSGFSVNQAGNMVANNASLTGYIVGTGGSFSGAITAASLYSPVINDGIMKGPINWGNTLGQHIDLFNNILAIGSQASTTYIRTNYGVAVYKDGTHSNGQYNAGGGTELLRVDDTQFKWKGQTVWTSGTGGSSSGLDADLLDGHDSVYFAPLAEVEALLGDLMYVGLYDPSTYNGASTTKPFPTWTGGSLTYRNGMYWIASANGTIDFLDADLSGRYDAITDGIDVAVYPGDWIIAKDPGFDPNNPDVDLTQDQVVFQIISFSSETFVRSLINAHAQDTADPHSAAGYLTRTSADPVYSQIGHVHDAEIESAINVHAMAADPHSVYLLETTAASTYSGINHNHDGRYEPEGSILDHTLALDPHPQYLTPEEGAAAYAPLSHASGTSTDHDGRYSLLTHTHPTLTDTFTTDGGVSARIFIGGTHPSVGYTLKIGDLWIETPTIASQPPPAATNMQAVSNTSTTITITWDAWPSTAALTGASLSFSLDNSAWSTVPGGITSSQTSYTHSSLPENTPYYYRLTGTNAQGTSAVTAASTTVINGNPNPPTSPTNPSKTDTTASFSWTAPAVFPDPATNRYEVTRNGTAITTLNTTSYNFTGLTENTTYTFAVRSVDTGGLKSTDASISVTTNNGNPPNVSGFATTLQNYNQIKCDWSAVSGISDLSSYELKLYLTSGMSLQQTVSTTNLTYTFTGLSYTTGYTVEIRAVDAGGLKSVTAASDAETTDASPDTTPPGNPTITSFQPETSYGRMVVRWTNPADTDIASIAVERSTNGTTWTADSGTAPSTGAGATNSRVLNGGTAYSSGTTVYVRFVLTDTNGNVRTTGVLTNYSYTLIATPTYVAATGTSSWRNTSGGQWNAAGDSRAYQGYFSNPAYNYIGCYFYSNGISSYYNGGRRTCTSMRQLLVRANSSGSSSGHTPIMQLHGTVNRPADSTGAAAPTLSGSETSTGLSLGFGASDYWTLPTSWRDGLFNGTYEGLAHRDTSSPVYAAYYGIGENGFSGLIEINHLG